MIQLVIEPEAEQDIADAYEWYERNRAGLGGTFLAAVRAALDRICENPTGFPKAHRDVRRTLLRTFPYSVLHRHSPGLVASSSCSRASTGNEIPPRGSVASDA
jgi:plasmid stabilization system protein ParE